MKIIDHWFAFGLEGAGQPYNPEGYQKTLNPGEFDKATRSLGYQAMPKPGGNPTRNIRVKQHSDGLEKVSTQEI